MRKTAWAALAAGMLVAAWQPALAETEAERQACENDAFTYCGDAIPDRDRVYHCLVRNVRAISPACRALISASMKSQPGATAAQPPAQRKTAPRGLY